MKSCQRILLTSQERGVGAIAGKIAAKGLEDDAERVDRAEDDAIREERAEHDYPSPEAAVQVRRRRDATRAPKIANCDTSARPAMMAIAGDRHIRLAQLDSEQRRLRHPFKKYR